MKRWHAPEAKKSWKPSILDATKYGAICPQNGQFGPFVPHEQDEQCLYLNVFVPNNSNTNYSVIVFIHGGGWLQGWGSLDLYNGDFYANTTNTIVVTMNYRLGVFGFLTSPDYGGNFGIMDQRLAIQWVHENIAAFGGDPSRVTLAGQSVGGISVSIHLTSPEFSDGMFSRVITQSNPYVMQFRKPEQSYSYAQVFANLVGCNVRDLACLAQVNTTEALVAQGRTIWVPLPLSTKTDMPWQPSLDGKIILNQPAIRIQQGIICKSVKQVLMGTVMNETTSMVYGTIPKPLNPLLFDELMFLWLGVYNATKLIPIYQNEMEPLDARRAFAMLCTDYYFVCPMRRVAQMLSSIVDVRYYAFMYAPIADPINNSSYCARAACHGAELAFEFHTKRVLQFDFANDAERQLSFYMMHQFLQPDETWVSYSAANDASYMFDITTSGTAHGYRKAACDIWDEMQ